MTKTILAFWKSTKGIKQSENAYKTVQSWGKNTGVCAIVWGCPIPLILLPASSDDVASWKDWQLWGHHKETHDLEQVGNDHIQWCHQYKWQFWYVIISAASEPGGSTAVLVWWYRGCWDNHFAGWGSTHAQQTKEGPKLSTSLGQPRSLHLRNTGDRKWTSKN